MFRITIDNEEVVSDKNITIEEEMLNTSSVILNNVYPKTWENSKDYTTNFYHPKDYSKCIIADQTYHYGDTYSTETGTSLSLEYDGDYFEISLLGNSSQNGTPTTSNTVPIVFATGDNTISVNGTDYTISLGSIELRKAGTIQDRIYKSNDTWYLEQNIEKVVLDGTGTWVNIYYMQNNTLRFMFVPSGIKRYSTTNLISTNFTAQYTTLDSGIANVIYGISNYIYITVSSSEFSSLGEFKTWLESNNVDLYYPLETAITTEITDTNLIDQLNSIVLASGTNTITITNDDLPAVLNIDYNYQNPYWSIDTLYFSGVVKNSGNISLNPRDPHYQTLQVLSYKTFLSEGETLDYVLYNLTIEEAIAKVVDTISSYGFTLGNINILNPTDTISAYSTKDKTAYDVFNYIADITQSRWTTRLVDEDTVAIDFYDPTLLPEGLEIDYTSNFFETNLIDNMSYSYSSNDYRNKQVMTSNQVYGSLEQVQIIYADGYQTQYTTELPVGVLQAVYVDEVEMTYASNTEKELGVTADFYYTVGSNIVESDTTYTAGQKIDIRYLPIVEGRQVITDNDEIDRINTSTGVKGVIARYENRNDATTSTELQLIGQSYIKYKGTPEIVLTVETRSNLWDVGDRVQFNAPIEDLDTEYMVRKKQTHYIKTIDTIFYTFEMVSSFNSEQAINYFDNQRSKAKGNIGEGEFISRNIDINNTANIIFYSTCEEVELDSDNALNSVMNAPLVL